MNEIVIDTNVLMHAENPTENFMKDSIDFLSKLIDSNIKICVDEGFDATESKNKSKIYSEYLNNLNYGSFGSTAITLLAQTDRILEKPKKVSNNIGQLINRCVYDKEDRIFTKIAVQSVCKILVSHDHKHFPENVRKCLKKRIDLDIINADQY